MHLAGIGAAEAAQRGDRPLPRALELERFGPPRLGGIDQRLVEAGQVATGALEGRRQPVDQRGRRRISREMPGELGGGVDRGRRRSGEIEQGGPRLSVALLVVSFAENGACARLVQRGAEQEVAGAPRIALAELAIALDAPAGHGAREFGDVGLRVAGANAERVQLHDFAREILVEPQPAVGVA